MKQENTNSLLAYYNCLLPRLTHAREIVLEAICELKNATDTDIAIHLNIPINRVSGRVGDLEKLKLIVCDEVVINSLGNKCRMSRLNQNYKTQATQYQQTKFGLEKAQEELPKQRYFTIDRDGIRREIIDGKMA
jgi:hypothetical protein